MTAVFSAIASRQHGFHGTAQRDDTVIFIRSHAADDQAGEIFLYRLRIACASFKAGIGVRMKTDATSQQTTSSGQILLTAKLPGAPGTEDRVHRRGVGVTDRIRSPARQQKRVNNASTEGFSAFGFHARFEQQAIHFLVFQSVFFPAVTARRRRRHSTTPLSSSVPRLLPLAFHQKGFGGELHGGIAFREDGQLPVHRAEVV